MRVPIKLSLALIAGGFVIFGVYGVYELRAERNALRAVIEQETKLLGRSFRVAVENALRDQQVTDVEEMVRLVSAEHGTTPIFLAASSWAAKLAVVYAAQRPASLSGLLLLGPGLLPKVNLSPPRQLLVVVGHLAAPTARLPIPLTPELYTANRPYVDFIRGDRLRLLEATTRFFWETARLDRQRGRASGHLNLPLLVLQGDDDKMMDVAKTRRWFSRLGLEDKTYVAYPGAGHTLDFEPDRTRYLADMLAWLSDRIPSGSAGPTGGDP